MSGILSFERIICSTVVFRKAPLESALAAIGELGFAGVELMGAAGFCPHFDPVAATEEDQRVFARKVAAATPRAAVLSVQLGPLNQDGANAAKWRAAGERALQVAQAIGAAAVSVDCGQARDRTLYPLEADLELVGRHLAALADGAASSGIALLVEAPHAGRLVRDAEEAAALLAAIDRPAVALTFDLAHHDWAGWKPADAARLLAPRIGHVHVRDRDESGNRYPLGAGRIDLTAAVDALEGTGYRGLYSLEFPDCGGIRQAKAHLSAAVDYLLKL